MWKYVSRRIRDVRDKTYTALDIRRPWQCSSDQFSTSDGCFRNSNHASNDRAKPNHCSQQDEQQEELSREVRKCLLTLSRGKFNACTGRGTGNDTNGSNSSRGDGFRRKEQCFQQGWLGAITWTGAIILGWYTSQLICLYRRSHQWDGPKYFPHLITSAHKLPLEVRNRCLATRLHPFFTHGTYKNVGQSSKSTQYEREKENALKATFFGIPIPNGKANPLLEYDFDPLASEHDSGIFDEKNDKFQPEHTSNKQVYVANDGIRLTVPEFQQKRQTELAPTVESAAQHLVSVIGEIEYQLGIESLEIGDYATAISHLKLGTSHNHAGAAFNLGICYEQGFGVKRDSRVAMECYHLASSLGHPKAMYNLGVYYARGLGGLRRNRVAARKYFTAAANLGLQEAISALGPSYFRKSTSTEEHSMSLRSSTRSAHKDHFEFDVGNESEVDSFKAAQTNPRFELQLVSAMA